MTPGLWVDLLGRFADGGGLGDRCSVLIKLGLVTTDGLQEVADRLPGIVLDQPLVAESLAEACAVSATLIGAHAAGATARYHWARVHVGRGQPERALALIEEARAGFALAGQPLAALRTDVGRMHVLDELGRHADAVEVGEATLADLATHASPHNSDPGDVSPGSDDVGSGDTDAHTAELRTWIRAATLENLGVAYGFIGERRRALDAYATAEAAYAELDMAFDLARVRANRGVELVEAGYAAEGIAALAESAEVFRREGDRVWHAKCLGHLAAGAMMVGDYLAALHHLEAARAIVTGVGAEAEEARLVAWAADASLALGLHAEAHDLAADAADRFRSSGMTADLAGALRRKGVAGAHAGRRDAAADLAGARELFGVVGAPARAAETALAEAEVLRQSGADAEARDRTTSALASLDGSWPVQLALGLMQLADFSDDVEAARHLEQASSIVDELRLAPLTYPFELRLGRLHRRIGSDDLARGHLARAVAVLDEIQGTVTDDVLRALFLGDKRAAIDEWVDFLLTRPVPEVATALAVCERARARTLLEAATPVAASAGAALLDSVDLDAASERRELNAIYNELMAGGGAGDRGVVLRDRASALERAATSRRVAAVATRVAPDEAPWHGAPGAGALVAYEMVGDAVDAFVVHGGSLVHRRLATTRTELAALVGELERQLSYVAVGGPFVERNGATLLAAATGLLGALHQRLIMPLDGLLGGDGDVLTVVPSGPIRRVPFAALHDDVGRSLASRRPLVSSPSATLGHRRAAGVAEGTSAPQVLVVGVDDPSIPNAVAEAEVVAAGYDGATLLLGPDATRERFFELAPRADLVHLACHGLHRAENPVFSAIRLADGWVRADELLAARFNGATVVLAACDSGRAGENAEPIGLPWALLMAGAAAVVSSTWAVDDAAGHLLMTTFHHELRNGENAVEALRRAQLATARQHPHPFFWAPFSLMAPYDRHVERAG